MIQNNLIFRFDEFENVPFTHILKHPRERYLFDITWKRLEKQFHEAQCNCGKKYLNVTFGFRNYEGFLYFDSRPCCKNLWHQTIGSQKVWIKAFILRTECKIKYARFHLEYLWKPLNNPKNSKDILDSFHESFLFHLVGIKDAFLQELNFYYRIFLKPSKVSILNLKRKLDLNEVSSPEIDEMILLEKDKAQRLNLAFSLRNYTTHRTNFPYEFCISPGEERGRIILYHRRPYTLEKWPEESQEFYENCLNDITGYITRWRESAIWRHINPELFDN